MARADAEAGEPAGRPKSLHANELDANGPQASKLNAVPPGEDLHPGQPPAEDPRDGKLGSHSPQASDLSANDLPANDLHDSAAGPAEEAVGLPQPPPRPPLFAALLTRGLLLALAWWLLSEAQWSALWIGALALPVALLFSLHLLPATAHAPRPWELLRFSLWFLYASLVAGVDVARQVLHPQLPIGPASVRLNTRLPPGAPRLLLAAVVGLLPGSVCVSLAGDSILLHQLNARQDAETQLRDVERRIAQLLGLPLGAGYGR